jgi:hypothetical protein
MITSPLLDPADQIVRKPLNLTISCSSGCDEILSAFSDIDEGNLRTHEEKKQNRTLERGKSDFGHAIQSTN